MLKTSDDRYPMLITGNLGLLASHVVAEYLMRTDRCVYVLQWDMREFEDFKKLIGTVTLAAQPTGVIAGALRARLEALIKNTDHGSENPAEAPAASAQKYQVWHFAGSGGGSLKDMDGVQSVCSVLQTVNVAELNCVLVPFTGRRSQWLTSSAADKISHSNKSLITAVSQLCGRRNINYRIFITGMLLAEHAPGPGSIREGLLNFVSTLWELKKEIDFRYRDYFRREPLRYAVPENANVNLVDSAKAAKCLINLADQSNTLNKCFRLSSSAKTPFADLCKTLSTIFQLALLPVSDGEPLNDIDRLFRRRVGDFDAFLSDGEIEEREIEEQEIHLAAALDQHAHAKLLGSLQESLDAAWEEKKSSIASMPGCLEGKVITQNGAPLLYYATGDSETPIVLINAMGQGLSYWYPLVDYLRRRHRVILWEQRGAALPPHPFRLTDQVADLEAILQHEGAQECYLVPWCTGLKISLAFYLRHPNAIRGMVVLNGSLHTFDTPPELETVFEHNFAPVCRIVDEKPRMAASVRSLLASALEDKESDLFAELPVEQVAAEVLARINSDLKLHVTAAFCNETVTLNYCRQILDFKTYDPRGDAASVDVPMLLIGAEYDKLTSPAAVEYAAKLFRQGQYLQVQGATHYFLYDQAETAGELIERFFFGATVQG